MRATALIVVLSVALLSAAALAGQDDLITAGNPKSRGSKAVVPGLISYQGILTDPSGLALDITETMTFTIYTDSIGGAAVWTETQPIVEVNNGLFNVLLGRVNAIPDTVFTDPVRWLGVKVGADPELQPRQRMAAVGYAFRASEADTADFARAPAPSDGDWTIDGNHMFSAVPGSVGIGITDPVAKLHVLGGKIAVSDAGAETGIKIAESWISDPYDGALHIQSGGNRVTFDGSDDVGIGTTIPSAKLDVNGDINADSLYKIRGNTVLSVPDTENVFVGPGAGANNTGIYGTLMGYNAGYDNGGDNCTFIGTRAGYSNEGRDNTFIGSYAGSASTSGRGNTFLGYIAGNHNTTGESNTFLGSGAGCSNSTGTFNTCVGTNAGGHSSTGRNNTYLGDFAGYSNGPDSNNVFVGSAAGLLATGSNNVLVGYYAGSLGPDSNNVFIGHMAGKYETGSNKLYIANDSTASAVLIYGDFAAGRVGIGTLNPASELHVKGHSAISPAYVTIESPAGYVPGIVFNVDGTNEWRLYYDTTDSMLSFWREYAGERMVIKNNGNVGIGTTSPTRKLFVDGDAGGTTAWYNDSDERLKKNISTIEGALNKVRNLRGVNFCWRDTESHPQGQQVGLIAQEVAEVVPEVVEKKGEYYSMATANLVPVLVEAMKEQQEIIERLETRIEELEAVVR